MGRRRTIDRESVLNSAELLVQKGGATALTLDAVAKAAGITKGGLQYCFGNKDDLITAMIDRWIAAFDLEIEKHAGPKASLAERARAYVLACRQIDAATQARMVGMLITLLQSPKYLNRIREWYAGWFGDCNVTAEDARQARTAIFAAEGAFLLRSFGFIAMDQSGWDSVFTDCLRLITPQAETP